MTARYAWAYWVGPNILGQRPSLIVQWRDAEAGSGWYSVWDIGLNNAPFFNSLYKKHQ